MRLLPPRLTASVVGGVSCAAQKSIDICKIAGSLKTGNSDCTQDINVISKTLLNNDEIIIGNSNGLDKHGEFWFRPAVRDKVLLGVQYRRYLKKTGIPIVFKALMLLVNSYWTIIELF